MDWEMRKAVTSDIKSIHGKLLSGASGGLLLSRPLSDLYKHVRDFHVLCNTQGEVLGCSAVSIVWDDLAEVRSLFLDSTLRGKGLGRLLVEAGVEEIRHLGIHRVFTLTYNTAFFSSLGFELLPKEELPQKVWADCVHCPKFPDCDENAMQKTLA